MRRRLIIKVGLYPLVAAGTLLAIGAVTESAAAAPPGIAVALPQDCDVSGGQPGGEHAPGGHDDHGGGAAGEGGMDHSQMADGEMDHSQMGDGEMDHSQMGDGEMDHSQMGDGEMDHSSHGSGSVAAPDDASRNLVLGGFAGVNAGVLAGAGILRRRTASRRERHVAARTTARPARRVTEGDER
ncbi:hypothetical protein [Intrasporangium calvum]|uniref:hypothetical protein n=1 Tax=Intrasporangium calvum TaxID=53358 RepID=UPI00190024C3|nr:hypothetical protein [Intrasporangium calvum]